MTTAITIRPANHMVEITHETKGPDGWARSHSSVLEPLGPERTVHIWTGNRITVEEITERPSGVIQT